MRQTHPDSRVKTTDYEGTPWLYHVTTTAYLPKILEHGLIPGEGIGPGAWPEETKARLKEDPAVYFCTDPTKWYYGGRWNLGKDEELVTLRVKTNSVKAYYDGNESLFSNLDEDMRLSDAFVLDVVPPELIEVSFEAPQDWELLDAEARR
jgi:hypothetical protein